MADPAIIKPGPTSPRKPQRKEGACGSSPTSHGGIQPAGTNSFVGELISTFGMQEILDRGVKEIRFYTALAYPRAERRARVARLFCGRKEWVIGAYLSLEHADQ